MLQILLAWKTYRTLKNGLLLDYMFKRLFYYISKFFTITFTVFFGDKYILESFFLNFFKILSPLGLKLKNLSKNSFISFFRVTIYIVGYVAILILIILFV